MAFLATIDHDVNSASSAALRAAIIDAYTNLTRDQLVLFLSLRRLPIDGSSIDLTHRLAKHDLETYSSSPLLVSFPLTPEVTPDHPPKLPHTQRHAQMPPLPVELVAEILDHVGDWELATAVGLVTALERPRKWVDATPMDHAVLSGSLVRMSKANASPLTKVGANSILRLGYIHILEYLLANDRATFDEFYGGINSRLIPLRASCSGRTEVLSWWIAQEDIAKDYGDDAIDEACRHGQLETLKWWQDPSHPEPRYTEAALENASAKGHIHILSWWKQSGLPLKVGRVMDTASKSGQVQVLEWWLRSGIEVKYDNGILEHASRAGRVAVLEWWHNSGLQMMYNEDVLVGATRHNRPEILQWWDRSGLPVQYRICDIEEALEDALRSGHEAREWWGRKGVDFKANNSEWIKLKSL